jgi:hypothetical protein
VASAAPAVFPARRLDDSGNDMLWNQQWILAFTSEARKKGKTQQGFYEVVREKLRLCSKIILFKKNDHF